MNSPATRPRALRAASGRCATMCCVITSMGADEDMYEKLVSTTLFTTPAQVEPRLYDRTLP